MAAEFTIDLTGIAVTLAGTALSVIALAAKNWAQAHFKDQAERDVIGKAIDSSLGAIQQAETSALQQMRPTISIPGVPANLAPGVQYVLDHAGELAAKHGLTPVSIAQKIEAKIGLANIATNLATTANATPAVIAPLSPVAEGSKT